MAFDPPLRPLTISIEDPVPGEPSLLVTCPACGRVCLKVHGQAEVAFRGLVCYCGILIEFPTVDEIKALVVEPEAKA